MSYRVFTVRLASALTDACLALPAFVVVAHLARLIVGDLDLVFLTDATPWLFIALPYLLLATMENGQTPTYKKFDLRLVKLDSTPITKTEAGTRELAVLTSFAVVATLSNSLFGDGFILVLVLAITLTVDAFLHSGRFVYDRLYGFDVKAHCWDDKVPTILKALGWKAKK